MGTIMHVVVELEQGTRTACIWNYGTSRSVLLCVCCCECVLIVLLSSAAVAFSGGCDSAALVGVAREIFSKGVTAVTVDHRWAGMSCDHHVTNLTTAGVHLRLRPESSQEAEEAARLAQQLGKAAPQRCLRRSLTVLSIPSWAVLARCAPPGCPPAVGGAAQCRHTEACTQGKVPSPSALLRAVWRGHLAAGPPSG